MRVRMNVLALVAAALIAFVATAWITADPDARAGDAKVAEVLFKSGRQRMDRGPTHGRWVDCGARPARSLLRWWQRSPRLLF